MKTFVLVIKVTPMLLAFCHLVNTILSYFYIDCIFLNYFASISIISTAYMYLVSYLIKLCGYYRMFLHYCVIIDVINIYDYYIGIPITNIQLMFLYIIITIIVMFVILYLKFFK